MLNSLKRYSMALFFLAVVIVFMLLGTLGVKEFGDNLFQEANITIKPKGEHIKL